jgi:hypothetical protein
MRKAARRSILSSKSTSQSPNKRVLTLSQETIRTLTSEQLSQAVSGCPTISNGTQGADGSIDCP